MQRLQYSYQVNRITTGGPMTKDDDFSLPDPELQELAAQEEALDEVEATRQAGTL